MLQRSLPVLLRHAVIAVRRQGDRDWRVDWRNALIGTLQGLRETLLFGELGGLSTCGAARISRRGVAHSGPR